MKSISRSKTYDNLKKYLSRFLKIKNSGGLAFIIINKFANAKRPTDYQAITAADLKERISFPNEDYKTYTEWRSDMVKNGILICMATKEEFEEVTPNYKTTMFKFGPNIKKYILAELDKRTHERIDNAYERIDNAHERIDNVKENLAVISEKVDTKADQKDLLSTQDNVLESKQKISVLELEVEKLKTTMGRIITAFLEDNPPDTPERRSKVEENLEKTGRLVLQ